MKYYLLWILTRCGDSEFTQPTSTALGDEITIEERKKDIVTNWYANEYMENYDSDGVAWFDCGNAVICDRCTEITQEEYDTFQKYYI
ncbi:MAG: hypothetical protein H0X02_08195 [Nitrosomonas sp.]|nr:hypothetical protein [Nitrosomonas sp.]